MAMAAHNPAFAKKKKIPGKVAREFNSADKRTGILRKAAGGRSPMQQGMDSKTNFGQGCGGSMFSTMPLMGHAMSGTQLGQADALIQKASAKFAEGGSVKKPAKPPGPSAKERKEIRALIEHGKSDAVGSLRETRAMLMANAPSPAEDVDESLAKLSDRLAMKGGAAPGENPGALYQEYQQLMVALEQGGVDPKQQMALVDRIAQLGDRLDKLGIATAAPG
jgi:hypothetical protein